MFYGTKPFVRHGSVQINPNHDSFRGFLRTFLRRTFKTTTPTLCLMFPTLRQIYSSANSQLPRVLPTSTLDQCHPSIRNDDVSSLPADLSFRPFSAAPVNGEDTTGNFGAVSRPHESYRLPVRYFYTSLITYVSFFPPSSIFFIFFACTMMHNPIRLLLASI